MLASPVCGILFGVPGVLLAFAAIRAIRAGQKRGVAIAGVALDALWIAATVGIGALLTAANRLT